MKTIWKNFNPRTGISWRPTDTTSYAQDTASALWGCRAPGARPTRSGRFSSSPRPTALHRRPPIWRLVCRPRRCRRFRRAASLMRRRCVQKPSTSIDHEQDRGNAALVQRRVSAHLARRIHGGNCVCRQPRPRHPRGLQHERGSRDWRRQRRPAAVHEIWKNRRHVGPAAGQAPSTTRCR